MLLVAVLTADLATTYSASAMGMAEIELTRLKVNPLILALKCY
jgi:hypothetical protein